MLHKNHFLFPVTLRVLTHIILFILLVFTQVNSAHAQNSDSLLNVLKTTKSDTVKLKTLFDLHASTADIEARKKYTAQAAIIAAKLEKSSNPKIKFIGKSGVALCISNEGLSYLDIGESKKALTYFSRALKLQKAINDQEHMAHTLNSHGVAYFNIGEIDKALGYYNRAIKIQEKIDAKAGLGEGLYNISIIYKNQGDLPRAIQCLERALKIFKDLKHDQGQGYVLLGLGEAYGSQQDDEKALEYYKKSLPFMQKAKDISGEGGVYNNMGYVLNWLNRKEEALKYHYKSMELRKKIGYKQGVAISLVNIGGILQEMGRDDEALANFKESLALRHQTDDKFGIANAHSYLTIVYIKRKDYKMARISADSCLLLAKELKHIPTESAIYYWLAKIDSADGNYKGAYENFRNWVMVRDSINSETNRKASIKSQLNFDFEKKEAVLKKEQEGERKTAAERAKFQNLVLLAVCIGLLLLVVFFVFVYRSLQRNKKANRTITEKNHIIEEKQKEIIDSIYYARRIQHALLPSDKYLRKHLDKEK